MNKFQGDDIALSIEMFTDNTEVTLVNLEAKAEIIIYAYTDGCIVEKYSKTVKAGYKTLTRDSATKYSSSISSAKTKLMAPGQITMEIRMADTLGADVWDVVTVFTTGVNLMKSTIKVEV